MTTEDRLPCARVVEAYAAQYEDPIRVAAGDVVRVEREDDGYPGWWWCVAADGRAGWVPAEVLGAGLEAGTSRAALEAYDATELSIEAGEEVTVLRRRPDWCRVRNAAGRTGWVPTRAIAGASRA